MQKPNYESEDLYGLILIAIILSLCMTGCGSAEPESEMPLTATAAETTAEAMPESEPIKDPDGSPEHGLVIEPQEGFQKFKLAESDCDRERCIVRIKVERTCPTETIMLKAYALKDNVLRIAWADMYVPAPDWIDGNIVTLTIPAKPTERPAAYDSQGYYDQSGVWYVCR